MPRSKKSVSPKQKNNQTSNKNNRTTSSSVVKRPRRFRISTYKSFRLEKRKETPRPRIASGWKMLGKALLILKSHWKLFAGILGIYAVLNLILVGGVAGSSDITNLKNSLNDVFTGHWGKLSTGLTLFTVLVGSAGSASSAVAGAYQTILLLLMSLVIIWVLRQLYAGHAVRVRDGFYAGVYPLVPFVLIILVIGLQLLPLTLGATVYSSLIGGGIAITFIEKALTLAVFVGLVVLSFYMICSSIFALYIVTLPDMTPMKALRSARELVRNRRWIIARKILFLPFALIIIAAVIMIPISLFLTPIATVVFFVLTILSVAVVHSYMYALYRELL